MHFSTCPKSMPEYWDKDGGFYRHNREEFTYCIPRLARFRVRGNDIWIEAQSRNPEANQRLIEAHLFGPVVAAALQRLGYLTLHANAVNIDEQALLICGWPSIGKSTLAYAMSRCGAHLYSDDLSALIKGIEGIHCTPGLNHLKLMPDTLDHFGIPVTETAPLDEHVGKRVCPLLPVLHTSCETRKTTARVRDVVILERGAGQKPELIPLKGNASFQQLKEQLFRAQFLPKASEPTALSMLITLAGQARVWHLRIPSGLQQVVAAAELLSSHMTANAA